MLQTWLPVSILCLQQNSQIQTSQGIPKRISGKLTVISLKILILNFSTLWEITSELDGGYASEEKFRYRKNSEVPDTLNSNLANLRMIPHFIREAMNDILSTNVSDQNTHVRICSWVVCACPDTSTGCGFNSHANDYLSNGSRHLQSNQKALQLS